MHQADIFRNDADYTFLLKQIKKNIREFDIAVIWKRAWWTEGSLQRILAHRTNIESSSWTMSRPKKRKRNSGIICCGVERECAAPC
jgi:hypothetical protein